MKNNEIEFDFSGQIAIDVKVGHTTIIADSENDCETLNNVFSMLKINPVENKTYSMFSKYENQKSDVVKKIVDIVQEVKGKKDLSDNTRFLIIAKGNSPYISYYRRLEKQLSSQGVDCEIRDVSGGCESVGHAFEYDMFSLLRSIDFAVNPIKEVDSLSNAACLESIFAEFADATPLMKTGFNDLDALLGGGLHPWIYVLGGCSSTGKTTFALQIADYVAKTGGYVLIFSSEMKKSELVARSISRETTCFCGDFVKVGTSLKEIPHPGKTMTQNEIQNFKRFEGHLKPEQKTAFHHATNEYYRYAGHITVVDKSVNSLTPSSILNFVQWYVKLTHRRPLVIVDYLQNLPQDDARADSRTAVNMAMDAMFAIKVKCGVPVFLISSLNRENYTTPLNLASFKESGNIEYGADVLLGLQFSAIHNLASGNDKKNIADLLQAEKDKKPRTVEISVLKNRTGASSGVVAFDYDPSKNLFFNGHKHNVRDTIPQ